MHDIYACMYTRLPSIQFKVVIHTPTVSHAKRFIYTAAMNPVKKVIYTAAASYDETNGRKTCFLESNSASFIKLSLNSSAWGAIYSFLWSFVPVIAK